MSNNLRDALTFIGVCAILAFLMVVSILILWKVDHDQDMEKLRLCYENSPQPESLVEGVIIQGEPCRSRFL